MHHKVLTVLVVAAVAVLSSCQGCSYPTNSNIEDVIKDIIPTGENSAIPTVSVMSFHPLCLAFGEERGHYRGLSVLVTYTCTGNPNCPPGMAEEQIESECNNNDVWSNNVQSNTVNTRSEVSEATTETTSREDCSYCLSPELIIANSLAFTTDDVTHCVGESIACLLSAITCE